MATSKLLNGRVYGAIRRPTNLGPLPYRTPPAPGDAVEGAVAHRAGDSGVGPDGGRPDSGCPPSGASAGERRGGHSSWSAYDLQSRQCFGRVLSRNGRNGRGRVVHPP